MRRCIALILCLQFSVWGWSQDVELTGGVIDSVSGEPIELVTVLVANSSINTETSGDGQFNLAVPQDLFPLVLQFSRLGYGQTEVSLSLGEASGPLSIRMQAVETNLGVTVTDSRLESTEMVREGSEVIRFLPSTTGNLESVLPHIALGARTGTGGELSSQYNVRGGNYDENLVYVNDFEIFRPQLIRSSRQEGLSFPNPDLMLDLSFSSGGFQSKYGDKMASVLDIRYKRPEEFGGSVSGSLLGGSVHLEGSKQIGATPYNKLRYLLGARYKTTRYLLGSLDVEGEFTPNFVDLQGYFTYDINPAWQLGALINYNQSEYDFVPKTRATALGLLDFSVMLSSVFEGQESDVFRTGMVGGSLTFVPERDENPLFLKLMASTYRGEENERFDIIGYYRLSQVETNLQESSESQEVAVLGLGTEHDFARNRLFNRIYNVQLRGGIEWESSSLLQRTHFLQWGMKLQHEYFDDSLNEWERIDSAGYSIPFNPFAVLLNSTLKSSNLISSNKYTAYIQDTYSSLTSAGAELRLTLGARVSHWNLNGETAFSPRFEMLFKPANTVSDLSFKLAGGIYRQFPFYREMRRPDGTVNEDIKSQRSIHLVGGITRDFIWESVSDKPFRLILEAYYKDLSNLITYDIDNVRVRYSGENDASGYAMGLDARLNGEFVPGAESWVNISFLRVRETLNGVEHLRFDAEAQEGVMVSSVPRPTDQFFSLSIFFQDYLPKNENFKVNLNMIVATGLPFGFPEDNITYRNLFRFRAYRRVDMGFSWQLWNKEWIADKPNHFLRSFKNAWLSLELFNLMGIENVSSNTWIRTVFEQQFAVPNNLTSRRVNLRFRIDF